MKDIDVTIPVKLLHPQAAVPAYALEGDAGMDLRTVEAGVVPAGGRATFGTGIALALPRGHVGLVHPRSGLAHRHGVTVMNAPGTVDSGYRGEIKVCLYNSDPTRDFEVSVGDRIAQLVVQRHEIARMAVVEDLEGSARGQAGFGSTGGFTAPQDPASHP